MPVIKEFRCSNSACGRDFEALVPVCPRCGTKAATRVFLTPPGINGGKEQKGSAKSIDRVLEAEFKKQGISNFSNTGGENKVTWARRIRQYQDAPRATGLPTKAYWSKPGDFSPLQRDPTWGFQGLSEPAPFSGARSSTPEMMPTIDQGDAGRSVDMTQVARSTQLPKSLAKRTQVIRTPRDE